MELHLPPPELSDNQISDLSYKLWKTCM